MFTRLELKDRDRQIKGELSYARDLPYFENSPVTNFKPGLNILFGPNGSGKSTILSLLGFRLAALQGGVSTQTEDWINKLMSHKIEDIMNDKSLRKNWKATDNFAIDHDGQPVLYGNPRQTVGLSGGHIDEDFFDAGITNCMSRGSTGQTTMRRLDILLNLLLQEIKPSEFYPEGEDPMSKAYAKIREKKVVNKKKKISWEEERKYREWEQETLKKAQAQIKKNIRARFPKEITRTMDPNRINDTWKNYVQAGESFFKGNIPLGQPTLLIDEPESGLSPRLQARVWEILSDPRVTAKYQIIVASHSAFALEIPGANIIEMVPGYVQECVDAFMNKFSPAAHK